LTQAAQDALNSASNEEVLGASIRRIHERFNLASHFVHHLQTLVNGVAMKRQASDETDEP